MVLSSILFVRSELVVSNNKQEGHADGSLAKDEMGLLELTDKTGPRLAVNVISSIRALFPCTRPDCARLANLHILCPVSISTHQAAEKCVYAQSKISELV